MFVLTDTSQPETTNKDEKEESSGADDMSFSRIDDEKEEAITPMSPSIKGASWIFKKNDDTWFIKLWIKSTKITNYANLNVYRWWI